MKSNMIKCWFLLVLLMLAACQEKEELASTAKGSVSLKATIESDGTRTSVDEEGHVSWVETDAIGVFGEETRNAKFQSLSSGSSVFFVGEMSSRQDIPTLAYYPYDENAVLDGNTLHFTLPSEYQYTGESNAPMLGIKQADGDFMFKHLCGLLKVTIKNMPENAKRLFVVSEGTEEKEAPAIAGDVVVSDVTAEGATLSIAKNGGHEVSIDLKNTSAQETYTFYLPVPVGEYPKLSVKLEMNDGVIYMDKSVSNVNMVRAKMLEMPVVDAAKEEAGITAIVRGTVDIENPEGLIVRTMIDEQVLDSNEFSVEVLSNGIPQIVYVTDKNDNIFMMTRINKFGEIQINSETTAIALISIMPSFVYDTHDNYDKIIDLIKSSPNYIDIIKGLEQIISTRNDVFESGNATLWTHIGTLINNLYEQSPSRSEIEYINKQHLKVTSVGKTVRICNTKLYPPYECIVTNAKEEVYKKIIFSADSYGLIDMVTNNWGNDICGSFINFPLGNKENGEYKFTLEISSTYLFLDLMIDACNAIFNGFISFKNIDSPFLGELFPKAYNYASTTLPYLLRSDAGIQPWDVFSDLCLLIIEDALDGGLESFCEYYINYIKKIDNYVNYDESWLENYPNAREEWENKKKYLEKQKEKFGKKINTAKIWRKILVGYEAAKATSNFINRLWYAMQATNDFSFYLCNYSDNDEIVSCTETELYISGGNEQEGYPKQKLDLPLKVFVKSNFDDGSATTLTDYQGIKFEVVSGGGYVDNSFVSVDENTGVASTYWTLGEAGEQKVRVVAYGSISKQELSEPVYFTAYFEPEEEKIITTGEATNITQTTATLSGNIQGYEADDFGHRYGIIYSTSMTPTASNGTIVYSNNIQEDGNYSVDVASLTENTTYYYRAFVVNGGNYVYGDVMSFTTKRNFNSLREALIYLYNTTGGNNWINNDNWCSDLPIEEWYGISVDTWSKKLHIDLSGNNLTGFVDFKAETTEESNIFSNVGRLYFNDNNLTSIDISGIRGVGLLDCAGNPLSAIFAENCPDLSSFGCDERNYEQSSIVDKIIDLSNCTMLNTINCPSSNVVELKIDGCSSLENLMCMNNKLITLDFTGCNAIYYLNLDYNNIVTLNLNGKESLEQLTVVNNKLTSINIDGCTSLSYLALSSNSFETISLCNLNSLKIAYLYNNMLGDVNFVNCPSLRDLSLGTNKLQKLDVSSLPSLEYLNIEKNEVSELNIEGCNNLAYINVNRNKLATLDLSGYAKLKTLYCHYNDMIYLNLDGCIALENLRCVGNKLTEMNVEHCTQLKELECSANNILKEITEFFMNLEYFKYDRRYYYFKQDDGSIKVEEQRVGWWYHGEPDKLEHKP